MQARRRAQPEPAMPAQVGHCSPAAAQRPHTSSRPPRRLRSDGTHPDDPYAAAAAAAIIKQDLAALAELAAPASPLAAQVQALLAPGAVTPEQYSALRLWLIWLLDSWGALVYRSWVSRGLGPQQPGAPAIGLLASRPVRELLYGARGCVRVVRGVGGRVGAWQCALEMDAD